MVLTTTQKRKFINDIYNMSQLQMARLWRFAPSGHPMFYKPNGLFEIFEERFEELGGMTPEISKQIGW